MSGGGSIAVRRQLGARLKRARLAAGKDVADVVEAQLASAAKISRLERGQSSIRVADVMALCSFYGVDQQRTDAMVKLAPGTRQEGAWWEDFAQYASLHLTLFVGLESAASRIRWFDSNLVNGLLQTEDYARAVISGPGEASADVVEQRVRFRMERQERIFGVTSPPQATFVMSEAALVSMVGPDDVMRDQIEHLRAVDRRSHVEVRVVPFTAGRYPRRGDFALLDFPDDEDPSVAWLVLPIGARYFDTPQDRARYERAYTITSGLSIPITEWKR